MRKGEVASCVSQHAIVVVYDGCPFIEAITLFDPLLGSFKTLPTGGGNHVPSAKGEAVDAIWVSADRGVVEAIGGGGVCGEGSENGTKVVLERTVCCVVAARISTHSWAAVGEGSCMMKKHTVERN